MRYIRAVPRLLRIAVLSAVFVLPGLYAEAADKQGMSTSYGAAGRSCGTWTADKAAPSQGAYFEDVNWVFGFVTAFNAYGWKGKNVASETDTRGMDAWVDNYCAANPTKDIVTAAFALITFLSAGPHPNDK